MARSTGPYTDVQRVLDFVGNASSKASEFPIRASIRVVEALETIAAQNYDFEVRYRMGDGVLLLYRGISRALLLQTKRHIRLLVWDRADVFSKNLVSLLNRTTDSVTPAHHESYQQWRLSPAGADILTEFFAKLKVPKPPPVNGPDDTRHPRHFSSEVRRIAFSNFERDGFVCPGFGREPHKVNVQGGDRIEYDHILPSAKGGSNSEVNVRVLCETCNRGKSDTIA